MAREDYRFSGFSKPTYTQVPDQFFDEIAVNLTEAELRVALYIIRRTFGFKKDTDDISLRQLVDGITTRDGRVLDRGAGVAKSSAASAVKGLVAKGIIQASRNRSEDKGDEPTTYSLIFADGALSDDPVSGNRTRGVPANGHGGVRLSNPQETVEQQTELQERDLSNNSNGQNIIMSREDAEQITYVVRDIAQEFADQAPLKSTATRAQRLYSDSGLTLDAFLDALQAARLRTKQYTGSIKTERLTDGRKPKMAYLFGVLEDLIGQKID